jgi:hypothetical protein
VHINVLELRRGRQHDIGVVGRIGPEVFQYNREQVVASKPGSHLPDSGATATGLLL